MKTLAGFIPPVSGRLRWTVSRPVIGWLAQRHALESQFPLTVQDVVSQGAWPHVSLLGIRSEFRRRIGAALERVGLTSMAKTPIEALSGGQFQRMLFARVIVQQAPLVMLDEPFTGIDEATSRELMGLILRCISRGRRYWRCCMITSASLNTSRKRCCWNRSAPAGVIRTTCCPLSALRGWHDLAYLFQPFIEFGFMRRALLVCLALSEHDHAWRLLTAATHESDGRCAVARHFTRRGGGLR